MSIQPSPVGRFSLEASGVGDDLVFGDDAQSSLAIPKALIPQIWTQINEGVRMLRGGLEIGGLLVGPKVRGGRVVVDGIIPLPIEYRRGPAYQMSPSDLATIAPAIESVQDLSKAVVGFYRSRTRGNETLRTADFEILDAVEEAHKSFAADFRCCLVLTPASESTALAYLAMRDGAPGWDEMAPFTLRLNPPEIVTSPQTNPIRQMTHNLRAEEPAIRIPVASFPVQSVPELPLDLETSEAFGAEPAPTAREGVRHSPLWLYAAGGLVGVAGLAGTYHWTSNRTAKKHVQPAPIVQAAVVAAPRARLGFSATMESPVWKLSWDRTAMDQLNPVGAVLSIQDGGSRQEVPLALADLATGTIFYTPHSSDLSFSLRVDRSGAAVEEHVRVLGAPKTVPNPLDRPPQSISPEGPVQAAVAYRESVPGAPAKREPSSAGPATTLPNETDFVSTPAVPEPAAAVVVPLPSRSEPAATPAPQSSAQAPLKPGYVGPKPIQQVRPQVPATIPSGSEVQVLVEIDESGKVTKASPVGGNVANNPLMTLAVRAASSWRFDPAQLNGHAVPSQMNLTFRVNSIPAQ